MSEVAPTAASWSAPVCLAGVAVMVLGTVLVILGVLGSATIIAGVVVLDIAMLLLAAAGVLAVLGPDA